MHFLLRTGLCLLLLLGSHLLLGQSPEIDSLKHDLVMAEEAQQADILVQLSKQYWFRAPDSSQLFAQKGLELSRQLGLANTEITARKNLGVALMLSGRNQEAEKEMKIALELAQKHEDLDQAAAISNNLGSFYNRQGRYQEARVMFQQTARLDSVLERWDGLAKVFNNLGNLYAGMARWDSAFYFYRLSVDAKARLEDWAGVATTYRNMAAQWNQLGQFDSALLYLRQSFTQGMPTLRDSTNAFIEMGSVFMRRSNADSALYYLEAANQLSLRSENPELIATTYLAMGEWYMDRGEYPEALRIFNEAGQYPIPDRSLPYLLNSKGVTQKYVGDSLEAKRSFENALEASLESQEKQAEVWSYYNLGRLAREQRNWTESRTTLQIALEKALASSNGYFELQTRVQLAELELDAGFPARAIAIGGKAFEIARQLNAAAELRDLSRILSRSYAANGNFQPAYEYEKQMQAWSDTLAQRAYSDLVAENKTKFETREKEIEIERNKIRIAQTQRERNAFAIGLLAFVFLTGLIAYLFVRLRANNRKIEQQRQDLENLNTTKDRLFAILAHDLRSPIAGFQSLGRIFEFYLERQNYERIQSLAHQTANQADQLRSKLDNLLNWSLQEIHGYQTKSETIQLKPVLEEVQLAFKEAAAAKQNQFLINCPASLSVQADPAGLRIVLDNLVSNAMKFTENGSVSIKTETQGKQIKIKVTDSGRGIPSEKLATLFEIKTNRSSIGTRGEKGTGLGLPLAAELTKKMGGTLEIESASNGTKAILLFPRES